MSDDARSALTDGDPADNTPIDDTGNTEDTGGNEPQVDDATLEEAKKSVEGLDDRYRPGARPTVALPGTNGTVAGTAFADMVDDDGELVDADDQKNENDGDQQSNSDKVASSTDG